jgi:hypothetical protein
MPLDPALVVWTSSVYDGDTPTPTLDKKVAIPPYVDIPETDKAFWTQSDETVRRAEIVVADVMFAVPLIVNPDAVTFPPDRVTPPITELKADIVELIMETPAMELLIFAGVVMDPLVVIVMLGE